MQTDTFYSIRWMYNKLVVWDMGHICPKCFDNLKNLITAYAE